MTQKPTVGIENQEDFRAVNISPESIQKTLGNVMHDKAFFFYEDVGKPVGDFAVSLSDFCNKINTVPSESLAFHLKRGDFENWIQEVFGDFELAKRIEKLKARKTLWKNDASVRTKLHATVRDRVAELQDLWHQALKWPEAWAVKP